MSIAGRFAFDCSRCAEPAELTVETGFEHHFVAPGQLDAGGEGFADFDADPDVSEHDGVHVVVAQTGDGLATAHVEDANPAERLGPALGGLQEAAHFILGLPAAPGLLVQLRLHLLLDAQRTLGLLLELGALDLARYAETVAPHARLALLVGTEGSGLSADALARADVALRIPMAPGTDSLNVATATGIALCLLNDPRATGQSPRRCVFDP